MRIFSYDEIDELGEGLIRQYLGADAERTCCVDIEGFATEYLKLPLLYRSFAEQDTDKIGFIADGITPLRIHEDGTSCLCVFPKGTIVIERSLRRENESGRRRFTISHECAHYLMDKTIPAAAFHREFDGERDYTPEDFRNLFSFHETLIDRMGAALLMPRFMVRNVVAMHGCAGGIPVFGDRVMRTTDKLRIKQMANTMGVSFSAFLIRLRELGYLSRRPLYEFITEEMGLGQDGEQRWDKSLLTPGSYPQRYPVN
jgi:hypothetical protein